MGRAACKTGPNIPFSVGSSQAVTFRYDPVTHLLEIIRGGRAGAGR